MMRLLLISLSAALLVACGEIDQTLSASRQQTDVQPWHGANNVYVAEGWKKGDRNAWEKHLQERQKTQDESLRIQ